MTTNVIKPPENPPSARGVLQIQLPQLVIPLIDQGGHGGIGHEDLNDPEQPVVLIAYPEPPFASGDWCELFWGDGNIVQGFPITPEHFANGIIGFRVPPSAIIRQNEPIYTTEVYYRLYDSLSDTEVFKQRGLIYLFSCTGDRSIYGEAL